MSLKYYAVFMSILLTMPLPGLPKAQHSDTLIMLKGQVLNEETNEPVEATITYEKLPYYDDLGQARSKGADGRYEMHMVENNRYNVIVSAEGYETLITELLPTSTDQVLIMEQNFVLKPNGVRKDEFISLDNLIFARGRAVISEVSYEELDDLSRWMKNHPTAVIQLEGHTDFQGSAKANMELSEKRVEAVKDYLTKKGVKKKRVLTKAFGGTQPLTTERTEEAKTKNRRVEVRIVSQ